LKGTGFFPCFALFIDGQNCLLLQETNKKDTEFRRIGLGLFVPMASQLSRLRQSGLTIPDEVHAVYLHKHTTPPEATVSLISTEDECTTVVII
jgi:hypothetical protein